MSKTLQIFSQTCPPCSGEKLKENMHSHALSVENVGEPSPIFCGRCLKTYLMESLGV